MTSKTFEISEREAKKRLSSTIQHKLRVLMKCYTIRNFEFSEEDVYSFNFNKTNKIRGIKIEDSKKYVGSYSLEEIENPKEDREYKLVVNVGQ
jgi:hypothetical protein